jgi:hypothetical protein
MTPPKRSFVHFLYRTADGKDSPQSIARIDRTDRSVEICRYFLRSVLTLLPPVLDSRACAEMLYTL